MVENSEQCAAPGGGMLQYRHMEQVIVPDRVPATDTGHAGPAALVSPAPATAPRPCHITFGGMTATEALRVEVRAWLERLGALTATMIGGQVLIDVLDQGRSERRYQVRMELAMPMGVVVVGLNHPSNRAHEDVYVAIRNAFRGARRELEAYVREHPPT
jgi:ribosome-associated translation inhibitor RaiA